MRKTRAEARAFLASLLHGLQLRQEVDLILCPPFTALDMVHTALTGTGIWLGAQDIAAHGFTGEISGEMLQELGCSYVIIGHSERRQHAHENQEIVYEKMKEAWSHEMTPILCVGETAEELAAGKRYECLKNQLPTEPWDPFIVAYEPVWAIGSGKACDPEDAQEVAVYLRANLPEGTTILYGGSVTSENIASYVTQPDIDGCLLGKASLDAQELLLCYNKMVI